MSAVRVRPAGPADAAILATMANDLNEHVGIHTRPFTPERVLADGFGPRAAFRPLVAEVEGAVVGYAFFSEGYNTDVAARSVFLHDLFVAPASRRQRVGSALMAAVAAETVRLGAASLEWGVHTANTGALAFYRRLGATGAEVRILGVQGERLRTLAAAAR
ncbi:MAG TPA: GNAT family N-acetyltransferase [Methylomirabilota bacterium]